MDCCLLPWGAMMISSPSKRLRPSICLVRQRRVTHEFANEAICLVMEGPLFFHLKTPPPLWQSVSAVTNMLLQWENNTNIFKKIDAKDALRRVGLKLEGQSFGMCDRGIYRVYIDVYRYIYISPFWRHVDGYARFRRMFAQQEWNKGIYRVYLGG